MLNGAKKTTFDIARISIREVTFQISNSDNSTSSKFSFPQLSTQSRRFRHFFHLPFPPTPNPHTSPPFVTHTRSRFQKKTFFVMPRLHFFSFSTLPLQAKTTYTISSFPNEILHKLTSCHFTLQNKKR